MQMINVYLLWYFFLEISATKEDIKWCVISEAELMKCSEMQLSLAQYDSFSNYSLSCVLTRSYFACMDKIKKYEADLMNLDVGLAYYAVLNYGMRSFAMEKYDQSDERLDRLGHFWQQKQLRYTANVVVIKGSVSHPRDLLSKTACFSAAGSAEGWFYPLSKMINENWMKIKKCNNIVQVVSSFFSSGSCVPGNWESTFNPLGDNGDLPCKKCESKNDYLGHCSNADSFAGSAGAIRCLNASYAENQVSAAFVKGDVITSMLEKGDIDHSKFELLCPSKQPDGNFTASLDKLEECNWGRPLSRMLMTRLSSKKIHIYKQFIEALLNNFGINGTYRDSFSIFQSRLYNISSELQLILGQIGKQVPSQPLYDLMFSDSTKDIYFPPDSQILNLFDFIDEEFKKAIDTLNQCPMPGIKWCVIDSDALDKCSRMKLGLETIRLQPPIHCILGRTTGDCMSLISQGYADLMTLDAAELYVGGKYLDLVPIAIEYYGDSTDYFGVAVVKEDNKNILISNWYNVRTCHGAAGTATGWVLPITVALNTKQIVVRDRNLVSSFAQLVSRACIPGILDLDFNPKMRHPINLCEICSGGGADLCVASSTEAQYTESGAFVCLIEMGDLAFLKHHTVYDNTDGRNTVDWARNKHLDDYELLCQDGRRLDVTKWRECNIGKIPGNTVVTAGFKSVEQREFMWSLLRHALEHFSSDGNNIFSMFESTFNRYDLMFSDGATSLKPIPLVNQTYRKILDPSFLKKCETIENLSQPGYSGFYFKPNF